MAEAFVTNIESFKKTLLRVRNRAENNVTSRYRQLVREVLRELAKNTPQYSGDLAASWQVIVGKKGEELSSDFVRVNVGLKNEDDWYLSHPHWKGDPGAVEIAMANNKHAIDSIRWNSIVKVINNNETVGIITTPWGQQGLRKGNYIPGDIMAVLYVKAKLNYKGFAPNTGIDYVS